MLLFQAVVSPDSKCTVAGLGEITASRGCAPEVERGSQSRAPPAAPTEPTSSEPAVLLLPRSCSQQGLCCALMVSVGGQGWHSSGLGEVMSLEQQEQARV